MPTEKRRINVTVSDFMWDAIMKYRNDRHLMSMSAAALDLVTLGLAEAGIDLEVEKPITLLAAHSDGMDSDEAECEAREALAEAYHRLDAKEKKNGRVGKAHR